LDGFYLKIEETRVGQRLEAGFWKRPVIPPIRADSVTASPEKP